MTITQTVEITESRRLHFDLEIPPQVPTGKVRLETKVIPFSKKEEKPAADPYEAITSLRGIAKKMGSTLTVDQFHEMMREDKALEEEKHNRLFQNKG